MQDDNAVRIMTQLVRDAIDGSGIELSPAQRSAAIVRGVASMLDKGAFRCGERIMFPADD